MTDLRYAFRQLIKSPSFSGTAIFALALGIGATTAMFAVIYAFLLRPLPYADPEKLVMLQSRSTRSGSDLGVNYLDFVDWQKQSRSFSDMAFFNLRWNGNLESAGHDGNAQDDVHDREPFHFARSRADSWTQHDAGRRRARGFESGALISERLWRKTFGGNPAVIGRQIQLDGTRARSWA